MTDHHFTRQTRKSRAACKMDLDVKSLDTSNDEMKVTKDSMEELGKTENRRITRGGLRAMATRNVEMNLESEKPIKQQRSVKSILNSNMDVNETAVFVELEKAIGANVEQSRNINPENELFTNVLSDVPEDRSEDRRSTFTIETSREEKEEEGNKQEPPRNRSSSCPSQNAKGSRVKLISPNIDQIPSRNGRPAITWKTPYRCNIPMKRIIRLKSPPAQTLMKKKKVDEKKNPYTLRGATKLPNFGKIHARQHQKMESIIDAHKRKNERAIMLLSGTKTQKPNEALGKLKPKPLFTEEKLKIGERISKKENRQPQPQTTDQVLKFKPGEICNVEQNGDRSVFRFTAKNTNENIVKTNKLQNREIAHRNLANKMKPKPVEDTRKQNSNILQGVRSNRRFDLLMKFRMKNKN